MEILSTVSTLRQQAVLLADYQAYRRSCVNRLTKLRKNFGVANTRKKGAKYSAPKEVTAEDVVKNPAYDIDSPGLGVFSDGSTLQYYPAPDLWL